MHILVQTIPLIEPQLCECGRGGYTEPIKMSNGHKEGLSLKSFDFFVLCIPTAYLSLFTGTFVHLCTVCGSAFSLFWVYFLRIFMSYTAYIWRVLHAKILLHYDTCLDMNSSLIPFLLWGLVFDSQGRNGQFFRWGRGSPLEDVFIL